MFIFDGHSHVYPDKIAPKASAAIGEFYGVKMRHDGTVRRLIASGCDTVGMSLICSVATVPDQVRAINDFISRTVSAYPGRLVGFAALHPDMTADEIADEASRIEALGLKGVKLHPDFQGFAIDDPKCGKLYSAIEGRLPVLIHTGDKKRGGSSPGRVPAVLDAFPKLDVICAHFGGYFEWDDAYRLLVGRRVWVDTSSSVPYVGKKKALEFIERFGAERVIFGSDYPMWDPREEAEGVMNLGLKETVMEKIFHGNLCALIGVKPDRAEGGALDGHV